MGWGKGLETHLLVQGLAPVPAAGTHTLHLARVQPSDSGMYMCEALNAAGRDQKLVQLSVLGTSCLSHHGSCLPCLCQFPILSLLGEGGLCTSFAGKLQWP